MARKYSYAYKVRIAEGTLPALQALAGDLAFTVDTPGRYLGEPSPAAMFNALAAAYTRDPDAVRLAFKVLGITPTGEPTYTSQAPAGPAAD